MSKTCLLCILDGFGVNPKTEGNAVALANTPTYDKLIANQPNSTLTTHSDLVGLPKGQMGNSEVGHIHIGAGRTLDQSLLRIKKAFDDNNVNIIKEYQDFITASENSDSVHLIGLYSSGGVHSHKNHLLALINTLNESKTAKIFLHIITDGRDCSPNQALKEVSELEEIVNSMPNVEIATVSGRYFGMDRDKRWDRTKKYYEAIVNSEGKQFTSAANCIKESYEKNVSDEFIEPSVVKQANITNRSSVIFWNFRADRMRQIVSAIANIEFDAFELTAFPKNILCFSEYKDSFDLPVLFKKEAIKNSLGELLSSHNLKQLRIAETEKYPHVTFFFNCGREKPYELEERILVPSPQDVRTYDLKPEMSAIEITEKASEAILSNKYDFIVLNFANCDMVGHTGNLEAGIKAVETADKCLGELLFALDKVSGQALIIADHGNAEQMIDYETGTPHTAHTTFPVPVICYGNSNVKSLKPGSLKDIAPTILDLMGMEKPNEMTGNSLIKN